MEKACKTLKDNFDHVFVELFHDAVTAFEAQPLKPAYEISILIKVKLATILDASLAAAENRKQIL